MSRFAKYLKMFLTWRLPFDNEDLILMTHNMSVIITGTSIEKKGDLGAFTVRVESYGCLCALCDNWASINLMHLSILKCTGLGLLKPTSIRLQMTNRSMKWKWMWNFLSVWDDRSWPLAGF
ncbi:hypothetical protein HAX54_014225 [Datura stramonium]|uniref:Uncharacterized protein n=1 Tax=Datura stramonium TaxID=4076 RepID=A0ABS8TPN8_DATST|nr:hypothetical protein [Datura stramonium]